MDRHIHLTLYGTLRYSKPERDLEWNCFQTAALAHLRDISLSSTPSRFNPWGVPASRFHHSVGVAHLADVLTERRPAFRPHRDLLVCAALFHDAGSPPFSHISEIFLYDMLGRTHEQQTADVLAPGGEVHELLTGYGVDPAVVVEIINGRHPLLGPVIAGSVDLDNIDNSLHLFKSFGHDDLPYHPLALVEALDLQEDRAVLHSDPEYLKQLLGWAQTRHALYGMLRSEVAFSTSVMLYRALEFAYASGALEERFFGWGEGDAMHHLRFRSGQEAKALIERLLHWRQYPMVLGDWREEPDPRVEGLYEDWRMRKQLADELAHELAAAQDEVCLYVGRGRAAKAVTLPFVGPNAEHAPGLFAQAANRQVVAVFCHKRVIARRGDRLQTQVAGLLDEMLDDLPERSGGGLHVFF